MKCDRFERVGLLQGERGAALDEHFATCPDCLAERAAYERLQQELAVAPEKEPPIGWQSRVWATIEERRKARSSRRSWWFRIAVPAAAVAAALVALVVGILPPGPIALEIEIEAGDGVVRRGDDVHPGDRLTLRATTGGARHAELWVYRNDSELVLRCSEEPPCVRRGDRLQATLALDALGSYQPLLVLSEEPLPAPSAKLDASTAAALAAGARLELGRQIAVR
jgi:hypothetical protein